MEKRTHKLSKEQKINIENLFLTGNYTFIALAKMYNVTPCAIRHLMRKKGYETPYRKKIPPEIRAEIVDKYKLGDCLFKELSKEYNVSPTAMRRMLNLQGCHAPSMTELSTKYKLDMDYFEKIDSSDKAYFLGLLYADGCVYPPDRKMTISLQQGDRAILDSMREKIGSDKPLYFRPPYSKVNKHGATINSHGHYVLAVINEKMVSDLVSHGVIQRKSKNLTFPKIQQELIHHFIRGFFDGDGGMSLSRNDRSCCLSFMANIEFLEVLKIHINNFTGINFSKPFRKHCKSDVYYMTFTTKSEISKLYDFIYGKDEKDILCLSRKRDKFISYFLARQQI
jgi:hypothetical protein